jgi:hypothetical protein
MIPNKEMERFFGLDLDPVKIKLMHESGEGWSPERTAAVETEYRRFLYLMKAFPEEHTSPTVDVDTFWHHHILDTVKYAADCEELFGYFLHHFPYVGMRGTEDREALGRMGDRMAELYQQTFGVAYPGARVQASDAAFCAAIEQAAFCAKIQPEASADKGGAAFCASIQRAAAADKREAAFCASITPAAAADKGGAAFCARIKPAAPADKGGAAFCASIKPAAAADKGGAAFCARIKPAAPADKGGAAFCASSPAFCAANREGHRERISALQNSPGFYTVRPSLAR